MKISNEETNLERTCHIHRELVASPRCVHYIHKANRNSGWERQVSHHLLQPLHHPMVDLGMNVEL